jgi:hypothetical protein
MRKPMLRISKFAPVALALAAAFLFAGEAHAQRGCAFAINCTFAECQAYQAAVKAPDACGDSTPGSAPVSCNSIQGCFNLQQMRLRWLNCHIRRNIINARCFEGGDLGHQIASYQAIVNVNTCNVRIAEPPPIGCDDPCP